MSGWNQLGYPRIHGLVEAETLGEEMQRRIKPYIERIMIKILSSSLHLNFIILFLRYHTI